MDNDLTITLSPDAATEDAKQIDSIVEAIESDMDELNRAIHSVIPERVNTDWSNEVLGDWSKYSSNKIPETLAEMKLSAANLRAAVDEALKYTQG